MIYHITVFWIFVLVLFLKPYKQIVLWYSPKTFLAQANSHNVDFFMLNLNAGGLN